MLEDLQGGIGIDTLFPVVGAVETFKSAFSDPVVGAAKRLTAPVVGVVLPRLSGSVSRFRGGLRRAVGFNSQTDQAPG
ncbi:MAG: hypothetical protein Q8L02_06230 [Candidatus Nitrotoga sp.]|nr:hypothetical protein [Candidatus Nitrotoga sp.]